jgi:copper(I)-binding protein/(2Fe-2S) ferredoxin
MNTVILFGRGMPRGEQERLFAQLGKTMVAQGIAERVETAFLEMTSPSLKERLTELAGQGVKRVTVVPAFAPFDRNIKRWLPRYLAFWKQESGLALEVVIGDEIEATASFLQAIADSVTSATEASDVTLTYKPLRNRQGFSRIPEYAQQVHVCLGSRCVMAGAWDIYDELSRQLQKCDLEKTGAKRIIPVRTACLHPCNMAPVCVVQPDNVWYGHLTAPDVAQIVEQHLANGKPVVELAHYAGQEVRAPAHIADMLDDYPLASARSAEISVVNAFVRPAMKIFDAGAAFMQIHNEGAQEDWLMDVSTPCSDTPRIHDASQSHDDLEEAPFEPVYLPAQGMIELQPGRLHMMLFDFKAEMLEGTQIPLTLRFKNSGDVSLTLTMHPPVCGMAGHMQVQPSAIK